MDESFEIGQILLGKYRIESVLGQGGMGIVLAARHVDLGKRVAIKKLLPQAMGYPGACERFVREARSAARLEGEHIAQVHDTGILEDGTPYILMEYLDGQDLKKVVRAQGTLSASEAASYVYQACEAVVEAHAQGIVHRDLKPANMMLIRRASGAACIKVLDFGISKELDQAARVRDLTQSGVIMCSPSYMAPEQVSHPKDVDPRSDIWALGVVLYELVTGLLPFYADSGMELLAQVLQKQPLSPVTIVPGLSGDLECVILKCLEKVREKRFQTVVELMEALQPFVMREHVPEPSRKQSLPEVDVSFPEWFEGSDETNSEQATTVVPVKGVGGTIKMPETRQGETRTRVLPKKPIEKTIKMPEPIAVETQTTVITDKRREDSGPVTQEDEWALPKRRSGGGVFVATVLMAAVVVLGGVAYTHEKTSQGQAKNESSAVIAPVVPPTTSVETPTPPLVASTPSAALATASAANSVDVPPIAPEPATSIAGWKPPPTAPITQTGTPTASTTVSAGPAPIAEPPPPSISAVVRTFGPGEQEQARVDGPPDKPKSTEAIGQSTVGTPAPPPSDKKAVTSFDEPNP